MTTEVWAITILCLSFFLYAAYRILWGLFGKTVYEAGGLGVLVLTISGIVGIIGLGCVYPVIGGLAIFIGIGALGALLSTDHGYPF